MTVSELRKLDGADSNVISWVNHVEATDCWLSVITLTEILNGIHLIRPKDPVFAGELEEWYRDQVIVDFSERLFPVDRQSAELAADYETLLGLTVEDALIGATAKVHNLTLATRNIADFKNTGVLLVNPWETHA